MEIQITKKIDDNYLSESLVNWNLQIKKAIRSILISFGFGLFFLFMASVRQSRYSTFWNIWSSFGIAYITVGLILLYSFFNKKSKFISKAKACIEAKEVIEYKFSESLITIRDSKSYAEFNWSVFSRYVLYRDYLLLYIKNTTLSSIIITRKIAGDNSFNQLLELINSKLPKGS